MSQWADANRILSRESSAEPGRWRTDRAPYLREILDSISDPLTHTVTWRASSQVAKTEALLNAIGYFVDQDPAPLLVMLPTQKPMAETFSKDRIAPMVRDTPCLRGKIKTARARDSGNTMLHKAFPGGHITLVGANAPSGLSSRPIRVVLADEIDRFPASAGSEGDPLDLAERRTETFWNRKHVRTSTPTLKGASRIDASYEEGDQREFYVPCPDCGHEQTLKWANVVFEADDPKTGARYACEGCGVLIEHTQKRWMLARGRWIASQEFRGHASFHINRLYSPWRTWADVVHDWQKARGDQDRMKVWTNTSLGESFEIESRQVDSMPLYRRREMYESVPDAVRCLTFGADVQADRIEYEIVGWGEDEESWSIDYERLYGDPTQTELWTTFLKRLRRSFSREDGGQLAVKLGCVDSGYLAEEVYKFCRKAGPRFAIPIKGSSNAGDPVQAFPLRPAQKSRVYLTQVGTDSAKEVIAARLETEEFGPGYCHFPHRERYDEEYFEQLTGEKQVRTMVRGRPVFRWQPSRARVEALDCRVYNLAAIRIAQQHFGVDLTRSVKVPEQPADQPRTQPPRTKWVRRGGDNWMKR